MTDDDVIKVSSDDATAGTTTSTTDSSQSRQRKKRKWDQPAESFVSAAAVLPSVFPNIASVQGPLLVNPYVASGAVTTPMLQVPSVPQNLSAPVPRPNQSKIQEELAIAREIVINDAESSVRYILTKRQTQEEIQKCTGAVVITRGKYCPPNTQPDSEKPLYLHISAGAHLKETAERILAVDHAAAMVEQMLNPGQKVQPVASVLQKIGNGVKGPQALSTCVFLGFSADPSLNVAARIRGPNDQYINHIANETGATVTLRGLGSGNFENPDSGEGQKPLHLFLSASNAKSLEDARCLAENLLDTISVECGVSRVPSSTVYSADPTAPQLGVQSSEIQQTATASPAVSLTLPMNSIPSTPANSVIVTSAMAAVPQGIILQSEAPLVGYSQPLVMGTTSYSGYGGLYPQATPLQQVAQVLRQSTTPVTSMVAPLTSGANTPSKLSTISTFEKEKQPTHRRKFQELPFALSGPAKLLQRTDVANSDDRSSAKLGLRNVSTMPAPKMLAWASSDTMPPPPPPPRAMPPPPPVSHATPPLLPPKFSSTTDVKLSDKANTKSKTKSSNITVVSDTLVKLMEYGDEDDDDPEETDEDSVNDEPSNLATQKPFWAV